MGTTLRVVLTIVAILFALLWGLVAFVNLLNLDRDTLAPEWIQSCFGIYLFTYILIFGFKPPGKATLQDVTNKLNKMGSQVQIKLKDIKEKKKESGIKGFWAKR